MATETGGQGNRRQWLLLAGLVAVLLVVLGYFWSGSRTAGPAGTPAGASNRQGRGRATGANATPEDLDVRLDQLQAEREKPTDIERNPFRFEARRRQESEGSAVRQPPPPPEPAEQPGPSGPPPPQIPLKFIGIIESPQAGRVAALSDGRRVFQGRVGDIIEGRYRIVRIGVESIVMEYADGSGTQQTIRLSGQ